MEANPAEKLYSSHEAGELLQMDPSSVVKWVNAGKLPAYRTPGGHRRIRGSDLVSFLQKHGMYIPPELGPVRRKLLIIDDDKAFLSSMRRALKNHAGLEVETAEGGIEGLVKVGSFQPEVLVLDVDMPDMDGLEVLRRLREGTDTRRIEVIVVSGKGSAELAKKVLHLGARAFQEKPLTAATLASLAAHGGATQPSA